MGTKGPWTKQAIIDRNVAWRLGCLEKLDKIEKWVRGTETRPKSGVEDEDVARLYGLLKQITDNFSVVGM